MKRRFTQLAVLVILGAIVNVAVAWGCAALLSKEPFDQSFYRSLIREYQMAAAKRYQSEHVPDLPVPEMAFRGIFRDIIIERRIAIEGVDRLAVILHTHRCGFPFRALSGCQLQIDNYGQVKDPHSTPRIPIQSHVETRTAIRFDRQISLCQGRDHFVIATTNRLLPFGTVWPGFAINTIFYAAILWILIAAPFKLRRYIRTKRHRCPGCSYPVGTLGGPSAPNAACRSPLPRTATIKLIKTKRSPRGRGAGGEGVSCALKHVLHPHPNPLPQLPVVIRLIVAG